MCLHPIILIFFFRSSVQDYHKLFLSSVVLGTKELNIGYNNAMSCYLIEKVTYQVLMEIMNATIDFYFFSFQIRVSNAVVVPVHHSSFSPSTHLSTLIISFCEWCMNGSPLTFLSSSISTASDAWRLLSNSCLKVTYRVFMEIMSATINFKFFLFRLEIIML